MGPRPPATASDRTCQVRLLCSGVLCYLFLDVHPGSFSLCDVTQRFPPRTPCLYHTVSQPNLATIARPDLISYWTNAARATRHCREWRTAARGNSPPKMEERSPRRTPEHSRSRCFSPHQPMVRGRSPLQTPPRQQGTQKPIMARGRSPQHTPPPFLNSEERSPHHTPQHTKYGRFA